MGLKQSPVIWHKVIHIRLEKTLYWIIFKAKHYNSTEFRKINPTSPSFFSFGILTHIPVENGFEHNPGKIPKSKQNEIE